jgi:hypothetical protein
VSFFCRALLDERDLLDELPPLLDDRDLLPDDRDLLLDALDLLLDDLRPLLDLLEERLLLDLDLEPCVAISPPGGGYEIALPTSSAFLRAARTSSVSSPICLPTFLACLPDFLTCLATPSRPRPVPGIGMPRTFFGLLFSFEPRTTPPTTPAAAVTTPVMTAAFDDPLLEELPPDRCALPPPEEREPDEREPDEREPDEREPLDDRADELRARDDAAEDLRLEALELFGLLRELEAPLPFVLPLLLRDALLFGLDPFELREVVFRLLWDREPAWAISLLLESMPPRFS